MIRTKSKDKITIEIFAIILLFIGLTILLNAFAWTIGTQSDNAVFVLVAKDIVDGNGLNGWILPKHSYLTTDVLFHIIVILIYGFSPSLMHIVPAIIYAMIIVIAAYLASQNFDSSRKWIVRVTTIITLTMFIGPWNVHGYLSNAVHITTILFILVSLLLLASRNKIAEILSYVVMVAAIIADPLAIVIGVVPILFSVVCKKIRKYKDENWVNNKLALKIIATLIISQIIHFLLPIITGLKYTANTEPHLFFKVPTFSELIINTQFLGQTILHLFGAYFIGQPIDVIGIGYFVRFILIILLGYAVWKWITSRSFSLVDSVMIFAILLNTIAFMFFHTEEPQTRYIFTIPIFGIILITRAIGKHKLTRHYGLVLGIIFTLIIIMWIPSVMLSPVDERHIIIGNWLLEHDLYNGYGTYWSSHIITIWTEGKVSIAPVVFDGRSIVPFMHNTNMKWYEDTQESPRTFLIFDDVTDWSGINENTGIAMWGEPSLINIVEGKTILIWDHPISIP